MTRITTFLVAIVVSITSTTCVYAGARWGSFTLGTTSAHETRQILVGKGAKILDEGQFAPTEGTYILAMGLPDDPHVLSSKLIFGPTGNLVGIFSKYPGDMFPFARDSFANLYRIAWVEYGAHSYPPEAQELARSGGYELVVTEGGEHAIVYVAPDFILRLVAKEEGFAQVEIMLKKAIGL